ncbi:hypothetical protein ACIBCT_25520 [Streptosporangium sp. NPDC050855]|uniref:hypothetical protein n=1 Tax=Streptosporangium sp. NPDC050855 TaxID=3366194 RepID=UPI00379C173F
MRYFRYPAYGLIAVSATIARKQQRMMMNRQKLLTLAGGISALVMLLTAPAAASAGGAAANPTQRCQADPGYVVPTCALHFYNFPGGTISIDVDANGTGQGQWRLLRHGLLTSCRLYYRLEDPPQSWVCNNLPADNYTLRNDAQTNTTFHQLGARW